MHLYEDYIWFKDSPKYQHIFKNFYFSSFYRGIVVSYKDFNLMLNGKLKKTRKMFKDRIACRFIGHKIEYGY